MTFPIQKYDMAPSLAKRIKRHVIGRHHRFFVVTAPGLERECHDELLALPDIGPPVLVVTGGVEFQGRLIDAYRINLCLRTAVRVLMRIGSFSAPNFRTLFRHSVELPWELYIDPRCACKIQVTARRSRLMHTQAIAQRIAAAMAQRGWREPPSAPDGATAPETQQIFVRACDDHFTISLDSSGEPLYKRGLKSHGGLAPIRETLAAALLKQIGYTARHELWDPMCGSGTFSLEAAMLTLKMPAGWHRNFAFMHWPAFRPRQWAYLRQQMKPPVSKQAVKPIVAADRDADACRRLKRCIRRWHMESMVDVHCRDFFDTLPHRPAHGPACVVLNPPYGLRLKQPAGTQRLLKEIGKKLARDYRGWHAGLIIPARWPDKLLNLKTRRHPVVHGGLKLALVSARIE